MPSKSARQAKLMRIAEHTPGGYGGVPQSVGKEFRAADRAQGKFQTKGDSMKKHRGKHHHLSGHGHVHGEGGDEGIMGGSAGISPRKAMGMGKGAGGGDFGVHSYEDQHGTPETHPDAKAMTGAKPAMEDHERGIKGGGIHHTKGMHPAQPAPDHGHTHPGGHMMHDHASRYGHKA